MRKLVSLAAFGLLAISVPASAQTAGSWRVSGSISGRSFVLECRLQASGGTCTDGAKGGKSHPLTSFSQSGDQVRWGFKTKVVIARIAMTFEGRTAGGRMQGTVRAAGRTGTFSATRS